MNLKNLWKNFSQPRGIKKVTFSTYLRLGLYLFISFVFYGSELFSPLHLPLALIFLFLALRLAFFIYQSRTKKYNSWLSRFWIQLTNHRLVIFILTVLIFIIYMYQSLVPTDKAMFSTLTKDEIEIIVNEDMIISAQLIDMMIVSGEKLLSNPALHKSDLTIDEQEELKKDWDNFIQTAIASEYITDKHRYFPQISVFKETELHAQSFIISYSLYMKKFEYFHKIIEAVGTNNEVRLILNEYSKSFGEKNSFQSVSERYFATNSFLRRNIGYAYHKITSPDLEEKISPEYKVLIEVANNSYKYIFKNLFSHLTHRSIYYTNNFNDTITDSWLPIQKTVFVDTIGNIHVGNRTEKFITLDDIATMKKSLAPGDIFVARKNWYASNVGIPGFWTHAGIYTGNLDDMENYFQDIFPYTKDNITYNTLTELLHAHYPEVINLYQSHDSQGFLPSVIESETKGTNINSLEYSAHVDFFGVLRTNLSKADILESLLRAFSHQGKIYDYEFSLQTKDEIFCSELVFDAFIKTNQKAGITLPTSVVAGKEIVAPQDIVMKFVTENKNTNPELSFVYFLDSKETTGIATIANEQDFIESYSRPKYSFLQE